MALSTPESAPTRTAPWIISDGRSARFDFRSLGITPQPATIRQYRLSSLGRYLLQPEPVVLTKRLIGCEVEPKPGKQLVANASRKWSLKRRKDPSATTLQWLSDFAGSQVRLQDENLEQHLDDLQRHLIPYDSLGLRLSNCSIDDLEDVRGICEDPGGNHSPLLIDGTISEKINYILDNLLRPVTVRLTGAHVSRGLFELGGFNFKSFDPSQWHRLVRFSQEDGHPRGCVLRKDHTVDFWLTDTEWVHFLQLFEHSVRTHPRMSDTVSRFMTGEATPLRMMINAALSIDYSQAPLPAVYQEVCREAPVSVPPDDTLKRQLSRDQVAVSMNYLPPDRSGPEALHTEIAILQDVRAIEPLRGDFPTVYSAIAQRAMMAEGGAYYLLDAIEGVGHGV